MESCVIVAGATDVLVIQLQYCSSSNVKSSTKREVTYIDIYGTSAMYGSKGDYISLQNSKFAHKYVHIW